MNMHYDRYLTQKYEPLYRDRNAPMTQTAMCWGFVVGDGWFDLINNLSHYLCNDWLQAKSAYDLLKDREGELFYSELEESEYNSRITAEQISHSKLRLEKAYDSTPVAIQVKEKFGGLGVHVNGATSEQFEAIYFAEHLSTSICDVCGGRGKLRGKNWLTTRCNAHKKE